MSTYTGHLKSEEELLALNYSPTYIKSVKGFIDINGTIKDMTKISERRYLALNKECNLEVNTQMFNWFTKDSDNTYSAKGKVKGIVELDKLGLPTLTMQNIINCMDAKGFLEFRDTAKPDIVVIGDGWTVPHSIFEYTEYDFRNCTGLAGDVSESFERVLIDEPSDTIPESISLATEHLNTTSETIDTDAKPFVMSNTIFNKLARIRNRTHYVKLQLSEPDLSFRLHYVFEDRPYLENKWVLKSHSCKEVIVVTEAFVKLHFSNVVSATEVFGERIVKTKGYSKLIKHISTGSVRLTVEK